MDHNDIDKIIEQALLDGTKDVVTLKDKIWNNLERTAGFNTSKNMNKRKLSNNWAKISAAAAGIAVIFFFGTIPGKAAVNKIRETLMPQKKIVQQIEGQDESSVQNLKESSVGYYIYMDDSLFEMKHENGKDIITPKNKPLDTSLPKIFMEISQSKNETPEQLVSGIKNDLISSFKTVKEAENIQQPLKAIKLSAVSGNKSNDTQAAYYLVDNEHGGTFIIKTQIFLEASEGFGVRFQNMLKEFKIVEEKK